MAEAAARMHVWAVVAVVPKRAPAVQAALELRAWEARASPTAGSSAEWEAQPVEIEAAAASAPTASASSVESTAATAHDVAEPKAKRRPFARMRGRLRGVDPSNTDTERAKAAFLPSLRSGEGNLPDPTFWPPYRTGRKSKP